MGVAMSITAFPVLARILVERRMLKRPVGALTLACAAIDDVTAWFLIALATAVAVAGTASDVLQTIALAVAFCVVMGLLVRPLLGRVSAAFDEAGRVPGGWVAAIFAGVLLSAYVTEEIGIARDLRRLRHGHDHAAQRGADRGRHAPHGGLRRDPPAAALLRLHRACARTSACSTGRACGASPAC